MTCAGCGIELGAGVEAIWFSSERVVRCLSCHASPPMTSIDAKTRPSASTAAAADGGADVAGFSAQLEFERRARAGQSRAQRQVDDDAEWRASIREERPVLGRIVTRLTPRPQVGPPSQSTTAWKVGAEGERRVGEVLAGIAGLSVLHDRLVPGSRANIDHLVVGPSGVFVIDAKKYAGKVESRDAGSLFRADVKLYVNGRDRTKLVDGVERQVAVVREALGGRFADVAVHGVLCFVGCEWGLIMRPKVVRDVIALWPRKLGEHVSAAGPYSESITDIAQVLGLALRPAATA